MDRVTNYFGQVPRETDLLQTNQNTMVALAKFCAAVLGTNTIVNAFTCTPTTPATLSVVLTPGEIYQLENLEATAWSSLPANTAFSVVKQGIQLSPITFGITPPATFGFSQVFLIEVQYADLDSGLTILPYFNSANPSSGFTGPGNSGTAQNTVRQGIVASQIKAGIAAATGTQIAPTADAGWTGLFLITVANGASTITAGNIVSVAGAPFIPATLPAIPGDVQAGAWIYAVDIGGVNAMAANVSPAVLALVPGTGVRIKVANQNTGATTFNLNGLGAAAVHRANSAALSAGDINAAQVLDLVWDGSAWQIVNYFGFSSSTTNNNTFNVGIPYAVDAGSTNVMTGPFSPALTSLTAGQAVLVKVAFTNTSATVTFNPNGLGAKPVTHSNGAPLSIGDIVAGGIAWMVYDGVEWQLLDLSFSNLLTQNSIFYVNGTSGSDNNNGLTPATAWATIQHALAVVSTFNLNGFNVTINVANGSYTVPSPVGCPPIGGSGTVSLVGNVSNPSLVSIASAAGSVFLISGRGYIFTGIKLQSGGPVAATADPGAGILVNTGSATVNAVTFGPCSSANIAAVAGGSVAIFGPIVIAGTTLSFATVGAGANITLFPGIPFPSISITAAISVTAFVIASSLGVFSGQFSSITGAGNVSGPKFNAFLNGVISTNTGNFNYLPGSSAGILQTGGQYG